MQLDFGCGKGGFNDSPVHHPKDRGSWLVKYGGNDTIAIDIDKQAIEIAKSLIHNGTRFMVADGKHLPFRDEYFDTVHEHCALHHIPTYQEAITEISRVTKTGGQLQLFETVDNYPINALARRIAGNWDGCDITSYFKTDGLLNTIDKYFRITEVIYYWHPLICNIISYFHKSNYPGWLACMYFKYYLSGLLNIIGLGKAMCCHVVVTAIKRKDYKE